MTVPQPTMPCYACTPSPVDLHSMKLIRIFKHSQSEDQKGHQNTSKVINSSADFPTHQYDSLKIVSDLIAPKVPVTGLNGHK